MKPLRPFPFPLNVGTDICQISRIYSILAGPRATRFVKRILTPEELASHDARLQILTRRHGSDAAPVVDGRDPELWKCAAFVAGRYQGFFFGGGGGGGGFAGRDWQGVFA